MVDRQVAPKRDGQGKWLTRGHGGIVVPRGREELFLYRLREAISMKEWDEIVATAIVQAKNGDRFARKWISDLAIGPPAQVHEHLSVQQQEVTINVVYDDRRPNTEEALEAEIIEHDDLQLD